MFLILYYYEQCAINIIVNASSSHFICRINTQKCNYWAFGIWTFEILIYYQRSFVEFEQIYIPTSNIWAAYFSTSLIIQYIIQLLEFYP